MQKSDKNGLTTLPVCVCVWPFMVSTTRVGLYGKRDLTRENDSGSNDRYLPPRPPGRGVRTVYHNPIVLKNTPLVLSG